jgi:hypothetical protein
MKNLLINAGVKTPGIDFNENGGLVIKGRSIHEDPDEFYNPVVAWVEEYCKSPAGSTIVDVELEYFNSGSAKFILIILQLLTNHIPDHNDLTINWYYEDGDDDILERGQYYSSLLNKEFIFIRER